MEGEIDLNQILLLIHMMLTQEMEILELLNKIGKALVNVPEEELLNKIHDVGRGLLLTTENIAQVWSQFLTQERGNQNELSKRV